MCGIVGYIGNKKASPILIDGLLKLEYRGYDSSGISTIEKNKLVVLKNKGRVENLIASLKEKELNSQIGIAHTRWATHGKPSKINSHPHLDNSKTFSVCHNGIIENYSELKEFLKEKKYIFNSETDSEIIPNLIHYYYKKETGIESEKILKSINKACLKFKGSFAIELISPKVSDTIFAVRKDSPLVIGTGIDENFLASDIPAILSYTKEFYLLNDYEYVIIKKDEIKFYNNDLKEIKKELTKIDWDASLAEKNGFEDFMLKEIYDQPAAVRDTIGSKVTDKISCDFSELGFTKEFLSSLNKIYIVACGTAYYTGVASKNIFEKLCRINVEVEIASEFRYKDPIVNEKTLCIFVSQSGETADTIASLKLSKKLNAKTIAITNVIGSSITREADYSIYTHAGPEIAVASTKAYTSQVVLESLLAIYFAEILDINEKEIIKIKKEIALLPDKINKTLLLSDKVKKVAKKIYKEKDIFYIGRGIDEAAAREGALKLKEISYIHSESYAAGELKHGPIALIEDNITVISIITDGKLVDKTISNIQEVISRGAKTLVVTNQDIDINMFDEVFIIPLTHPYISTILSVIPLQLLSYYITKEKGLNVDKPRNLAKSVTVE